MSFFIVSRTIFPYVDAMEKNKARQASISAEDFIKNLKRELAQRQSKNSRYSLRQFAQYLGTSRSTLSDIFNGKRPLSAKMRKKIVESLRIDESFGNSSSFFSRMELEDFTKISDWYVYALLELMLIPQFNGNIKGCAEALGISKYEVELALDALVDLEILAIEDGKWIDLDCGYTSHINPKKTSVEAANNQISLLEKSIRSLRFDSLEERDHTSLTFAFNRQDLPQLKLLLKEFRRKLAKILGSKENFDDVYSLTFSLFPLTDHDYRHKTKRFPHA